MDGKGVRIDRRLTWLSAFLAAAVCMAPAQGSGAAAAKPPSADESKPKVEDAASKTGAAEPEGKGSTTEAKPKPKPKSKPTPKNKPTPSAKPTSKAPAHQPAAKPAAPTGGSSTSAPRTAPAHSQAAAHVYTNEDLSRYIRPEDRGTGAVDTPVWDGTTPAKAEKGKAGEERSKPNQASPVTDAKALSDAQARVKTAQEQVEVLKKLTLSDSNPLMPPPGLSEADKARRQGLPRDQLLQQTRDRLKSAEQELEAAKSRLEAMQAPKL